MDLARYIKELHREKVRLDHAIAVLEAMIAERKSRDAAPKRRGRTSMGPAERALVSARMKKYWATRRKKQ